MGGTLDRPGRTVSAGSLPPAERRYGEKDIGRIIKRASQLQRETPARPDPSGLTLAELEEIAREAGIDPENVRRAAGELTLNPAGSWETRVLGAPLVQRLERRVPGELPAEAFGSLVPLLQSESGMNGQASTVGHTLTWASGPGGNHSRTLNILVVAEGGETLIQLEERSTQAAIGFHVGFSSGGLGFAVPAGLGLGAAAGVVAGLGAGVGLAGLFYLAGRTLYAATTRRRRRRVERMFERLVGRVRDAIAERTGALPPSDA